MERKLAQTKVRERSRRICCVPFQASYISSTSPVIGSHSFLQSSYKVHILLIRRLSVEKKLPLSKVPILLCWLRSAVTLARNLCSRKILTIPPKLDFRSIRHEPKSAQNLDKIAKICSKGPKTIQILHSIYKKTYRSQKMYTTSSANSGDSKQLKAFDSFKGRGCRRKNFPPRLNSQKKWITQSTPFSSI